jgi:DNA excision repair protein ERCC-3
MMVAACLLCSLGIYPSPPACCPALLLVCVESTNPDVLRELLRHRTISQARIVDASVPTSGDDFEQVATLSELAQNTLFDENTLDADDDSDDEGEGSGLVGASSSSSSALGVKTKAPKKTTVTFRIRNECVQEVKRTAQAASYPLMEEYDFRSDKRNANVDINIKPTTKIRSYQEKSLSKMFGNGRARSGLIVLPCGAGKSLTGVIATSTVKKSTMILCINNASVTQWKEQLLMWTSIQERDVKCVSCVFYCCIWLRAWLSNTCFFGCGSAVDSLPATTRTFCPR